MNPQNLSAPLVSIIVPTFNRSEFIERCVHSILNQTYRNIECLVMDGASTDDSVAKLKRISSHDPRLRFISEPDNGEVDAVNKGLDLVSGDIVGFQNSDDYYVPDAVETSVRFLQTHPDCIGVSGDARYVDAHGKDLRRGVITYRGEMIKRNIRRILILRYKSTFICHGAFFGWRKQLLAHGKFDPAFGVMPDLEFYSRLLQEGERIGCLPRVQFHFAIHPGMGALKHVRKVEEQRAVLHARYGMRWYHELLWTTIGKGASYMMNPYRTSLWEGIRWELRMLAARARHGD